MGKRCQTSTAATEKNKQTPLRANKRLIFQKRLQKLSIPQVVYRQNSKSLNAANPEKTLQPPNATVTLTLHLRHRNLNEDEVEDLREKT